MFIPESNMSTPTPLRSFLGGVGLSFPVHALLTLNGSVFGISGFLHRAVRGSKEGSAALLGFVSGGVAVGLLEGRGPQLWMPKLPMVLLSGLLVGVGTRMANGCTSGHMIAGLSRLSKRSITATLTFFATGVPVSRLLHSSLPPRYASEPFALNSYAKTLLAAQAIPLLFVSLLYLQVHQVRVSLMSLFNPVGCSFILTRIDGQTPLPLSSENADPNAEKVKDSTSRLLTFWATGVEFALALRLSELSDPIKVISFLLLPVHPAFDVSLMFLALGALPVSFCLYHFCRGPEKPRLGGTWSIPKDGLVDAKLVFGAALFGIGWGISGICPGPALVNLGRALASGEEIPINLAWLATFIIGGFVAG